MGYQLSPHDNGISSDNIYISNWLTKPAQSRFQSKNHIVPQQMKYNIKIDNQ